MLRAPRHMLSLRAIPSCRCPIPAPKAARVYNRLPYSVSAVTAVEAGRSSRSGSIDQIMAKGGEYSRRTCTRVQRPQDSMCPSGESTFRFLQKYSFQSGLEEEGAQLQPGHRCGWTPLDTAGPQAPGGEGISYRSYGRCRCQQAESIGSKLAS